MSEEKLYAVKNDEGKWLSINDTEEEIWYWNNPMLFKDKSYAEAQSMGYKDHIVALIEEPEKVVLTKEQAEAVEKAHTISYPAYYISVISGKDEELLMNAYVNGYTVADDKKYNVKVPHTDDVWYYKSVDGNLQTFCPENKKLRGTFTEKGIEHYGLQDCEKVECDNDGE